MLSYLYVFEVSAVCGLAPLAGCPVTAVGGIKISVSLYFLS